VLGGEAMNIELDVVCDDCGKPLVAEFNAKRNRIDVAPCQTCIDSVRETAYADGMKDAEE
jgi:hypothetical protein